MNIPFASLDIKQSCRRAAGRIKRHTTITITTGILIAIIISSTCKAGSPEIAAATPFQNQNVNAITDHAAIMPSPNLSRKLAIHFAVSRTSCLRSLRPTRNFCHFLVDTINKISASPPKMKLYIAKSTPPTPLSKNRYIDDIAKYSAKTILADRKIAYITVAHAINLLSFLLT